MRSAFTSFLVYCTFFFSFFTASGQTKTDTVRIIDDILESWKNDGPGAALLIKQGEREIYKKAFGYANLELDIKNTPQTVFEAGSVSKQFTATAILLLVEEGKISLEDDIRKYLPQLPNYQKKITINNLITHTSGVKDWRNIVGLSAWPTGAKVYSNVDIMEVICRQQPLSFDPGTEYAYSNSNYTLLVSLVEKVTGKTFADYTHEKIFVPVDMTQTKWRNNFRAVVKHRASGYSQIKNTYVLDMPFENGHGPGGLITTLDDLHKWNAYWAAGKFGKTLEAFRTKKYVLSNGIEIPYTSGAINIKLVNNHRVFSHSGATAGYRSLLTYYPELNISVVLLSNFAGTNTSAIGKALDDLFTSKKPVSSVFLQTSKGSNLEPSRYSKYAGLYRRPGRYEIKQITLNDKALLNDNVKMYVLQGDTLISGSEKVVFQNEQSLKVITSSGVYLYEKVTPFTPKKVEISQYLGAYYSEEAGANLKITEKDGVLHLERERIGSIPMTALFQDTFKAGAVILHFQKGTDNAINSISLSLSRAENLIFRKK